MKILCKGSTKEKGPSETNLFSAESVVIIGVLWGTKSHLGEEGEKISCSKGEVEKKSFTHSFEISLSHHLFTTMAEDHENRSREAFAGW